MSQSPWIIAADLLLVREHVFHLDSVPELRNCCSHLFFLVESLCCWLRKHPHLLVEQAQCYCPPPCVLVLLVLSAICFLLTLKFNIKPLYFIKRPWPCSFNRLLFAFLLPKKKCWLNCLDSLPLHFSHQAGAALVMFGTRGRGGSGRVCWTHSSANDCAHESVSTIICRGRVLHDCLLQLFHFIALLTEVAWFAYLKVPTLSGPLSPSTLFWVQMSAVLCHTTFSWCFCRSSVHWLLMLVKCAVFLQLIFVHLIFNAHVWE